jgi:hypothetical protein
MKNNLDYEKAKQIMHFQRIAFFDIGMAFKTLDELPTPRILKSHLPFQFLPENLNKRAKVDKNQVNFVKIRYSNLKKKFFRLFIVYEILLTC